MVVVREENSWLWFGGAPSPTRIGGPTHAYHLRSTPDGRHLVAFVLRPGAEVIRLNAATGTAGPAMDGTRICHLIYSPDASSIAWVSADLWPGRLWLSRPDGTERLSLSDLGVHGFARPTWSPDGRFIAFTTDLRRAAARAPFRLHLASPSEGTVEPLTTEDPGAAQFDACWSPDSRWLAYGGQGPSSEEQPGLQLRRVDLATRRVTRLEGSEGLWSPLCAPDGRILARDGSAQAAEADRTARGGPRAHFKVRDPASGRWTPLFVDLPSGATGVSYPSWSRDGRHVFMNAGSSLVRWDVTSPRAVVVADMTAFDGGTMVGLDPDDNPLVSIGRTDREIVVMDLGTE
jgi:Tol biopolymer transport system component